MSGGQHPSEAISLRTYLLENVNGEQGYLPKRLGDGLDFVTRTGKADDLEDSSQISCRRGWGSRSC